MRYPASEKLEIIRLVEQSYLPVRRTLEKLGVSRPTFYLYGRLSRCKSIFELICLVSCTHLSGVTRWVSGRPNGESARACLYSW